MRGVLDGGRNAVDFLGGLFLRHGCKGVQRIPPAGQY
jgi:hypothetical protein